ncbi:D-alanyl-D-alanine carboxypeptidase [Candidatus Curtissbacteria bacterium]|nr:D-alanyl-D-alanine carboxypeptidase [Candidatus Curtissbacteria bacterium]
MFVVLMRPGSLPVNVPGVLVGNRDSSELPKLYPYPVPTETFRPPETVSARSAIVIDAKTGITLFEKDPDVRHLPASTTKLMTALVALERCSPGNIINVTDVIQEGTLMGLSAGDTVTAETLLYGLLVSSGNDAAYVLASSCSDSSEHFVSSMNQKARELGMANTHFENPAGLDSPMQYSTARDLAKLAKVAVANPLISKIVGTRGIVLTDVAGVKIYYLENINKLLGEVEGLEGVKTGQTEGSLEILLTKTTRAGNTVIVAVLGSRDRFGESKKLIEWAFANHRWRQP